MEAFLQKIARRIGEGSLPLAEMKSELEYVASVAASSLS
jgi:hypothetical protein